MSIKKSGGKFKPSSQSELPGMPKRSPAGEKAIEYLNLKSELEQKQEALEETGKDLIVLMHKENHSKMTVNGVTLTVRFIESKEKLILKKEV